MPKAPDSGDLLDQWKSKDPAVSAEAESVLKRDGPAALIPLLRTPDEIALLNAPLPLIKLVHIAGCAAVLNLFLLPLSFTFARMFRSPLPVLVPIILQAGLLAWAWRNRASLRARVKLFARKQIRHARLAEEALSLFKDPVWDDAFLDGLLLEQSDGPDLVRPPAHPIYPVVRNLLSRMDAHQAAVLLPKHRAALSKLLDVQHAEHHMKLIQIILDTLARFGDRQFYKRVKALAGQRELDRAGGRLREEAADCVRKMEARFEKEKVSRTLLRPSESVGADSSHLLHPSVPANADPQFLLHETVEQGDYVLLPEGSAASREELQTVNLSELESNHE